MNFTLHMLYAATRSARHNLNTTHDDYRKEHDANTAIAIVIRHTSTL